MSESKHPADALSDERQFMETLLNTRANFSIVVFGLALAGAATVDSRSLQFALLLSSTILSAFLAMATSRAQWKLDLLFRELPGEHPAKMVDALAAQLIKDRRVGLVCRVVVGKSRRRLVGYVVPWYTVVLLLLATILAPLGTFVSKGSELAPSKTKTDSLSATTIGISARVDSLSNGLARDLRIFSDSLASVAKRLPRTQAKIPAPH